MSLDQVISPLFNLREILNSTIYERLNLDNFTKKKKCMYVNLTRKKEVE